MRKIIIEGIEYSEQEIRESFKRDKEIIESFAIEANFEDYLATLKQLYLA